MEAESCGHRRAVTYAATGVSGWSCGREVQVAHCHGYCNRDSLRTCIRAFVKMAYAKDVSQDELIELLEVAMTMQGYPGEEWALKAYVAYKECMDDQTGLETPTCCKNDHRSQTDKEGDNE